VQALEPMPTLEVLQHQIEIASPGIARKPRPSIARAGGDKMAERCDRFSSLPMERVIRRTCRVLVLAGQ
jgi:hypothetical protein